MHVHEYNKIYEFVYILVLRMKINIAHYALGTGSVDVHELKLRFKPTQDDGQNIKDKLFQMWLTVVRIQQKLVGWPPVALTGGRRVSKSKSFGQVSDNEYKDDWGGS